MNSIRSFGIDIPEHKILMMYNHITGEQLIFSKRSNVYFIGFRPDEKEVFKLIPSSVDHDLAYEEYTEAIKALSFPNFKLK